MERRGNHLSKVSKTDPKNYTNVAKEDEQEDRAPRDKEEEERMRNEEGEELVIQERRGSGKKKESRDGGE